jgi:hypothetical protein
MQRIGWGTTPWPGSLFEGVTSRPNSLFIITKTLGLGLGHCKDPDESLKVALHSADGTSLKSLYGLYSSILKARIVDNDDFQQTIGIHLTTAPSHPFTMQGVGYRYSRPEVVGNRMHARPSRSDIGTLVSVVMPLWIRFHIHFSAVL